MGEVQTRPPELEPTPVDDVRRIRERLSVEYGNDVEKLADYAEQLAGAWVEKLGLRPATFDK